VDTDRVADGFKIYGGVLRPNSDRERVLAPDKGPPIPIVSDERMVGRAQGFRWGALGPTRPIDHIESFAYLSFAVWRWFGTAPDARR